MFIEHYTDNAVIEFGKRTKTVKGNLITVSDEEFEPAMFDCWGYKVKHLEIKRAFDVVVNGKSVMRFMPDINTARAEIYEYEDDGQTVTFIYLPIGYAEFDCSWCVGYGDDLYFADEEVFLQNGNEWH